MGCDGDTIRDLVTRVSGWHPRHRRSSGRWSAPFGNAAEMDNIMKQLLWLRWHRNLISVTFHLLSFQVSHYGIPLWAGQWGPLDFHWLKTDVILMSWNKYHWPSFNKLSLLLEEWERVFLRNLADALPKVCPDWATRLRLLLELELLISPCFYNFIKC